jgi:protein O-GlcNAc transferase
MMQICMALGDLYLNAQSVFEYGLGESTFIAAHTGVPRYSGVDSDAVWVVQARENSKLDHFRFNFADIGATQLFGNPTDNTLQKIQYDYQMAPLVLEDEAFDVYLVDGRYRVACACLSFLHAIKAGGNMDLVRVGVHDNDANYGNVERHYEVLTNVADVVVRNSKLWVYKLKKHATEEDLYALWEQSRSKQV